MILLQLILITFICVMGLKIVFSKGMLLESVGIWAEEKVESGEKIYDLFICPWCMGTVQSITAHLFAFGIGVLPFEWHWSLLIRWPLVIMGASFLSGLSWTIYETINTIKERNEWQSKLYEKQEQLAHFDICDRKEQHKQKVKN